MYLQESRMRVILENMKANVEKCSVCQHNKAGSVYSAGLLQPLLALDRVWEDRTMDFIEGLPIMYGHFLTPKHPFSTKEVVALFIRLQRFLGSLTP